jgi:hypothetical protein
VDCRGRIFQAPEATHHFSSSPQISFAVIGPSFADSIEHAHMRR